MGRLRGEHVYTTTGPQRPVFLVAGKPTARFELALPEGGEGVVQVTHDPVAKVRDGKALWETLDEMADGIYGVTALRAVIKKLDGWGMLVVEQG